MPKIDCKPIREKILKEVKDEIDYLGAKPTLAIISCSNDEASVVYMRNKIKTCESVGIKVTHYNLVPKDTDTDDICELVDNCGRNFTSIIVQLPLAGHIDSERVLSCIPTLCDVDGLTDANIVKLIKKDEDAIVPCTPLAVLKIIEYAKGNDDLSFLDVQILSRSRLIGKPLAQLLLNHNATIHQFHSLSPTFHYLMPDMDIVVSGIGSPYKVNTYYSREGTIFIDCGISFDENGKILRDVDYKEKDKVDYYYNVGVVTTSVVAYNVLKCWKLQKGRELNEKNQ